MNESSKKVNKPHHIIFEGAELVGKSFLISKIYDYLEQKDNSSTKILNGCHWFNCDNGIFGTKDGKNIINNYINILEDLKHKNVIFEKFHLTDKVYNGLYNNIEINYKKEEKKLKKLNTKIILITVKNEKVFEDRIANRLNNTPHYKRILQKPSDYLKQQNKYIEYLKNSSLKNITIDFSKPLNKKYNEIQINKIINWLEN